MNIHIRRYAFLYLAAILTIALLVANATAHRWPSTLALVVIVFALLAVAEGIDRDATRTPTPLPAGTLLARDAVRLQQLYADAIATEHRRRAAAQIKASPEEHAENFAAAVMEVRDIELETTIQRARTAVERHAAMGAQRRQLLDLAKFWECADGVDGIGLRVAAEELRQILNSTAGSAE